MNASGQISTAGFRIAPGVPFAYRMPSVIADVDGEDWGSMDAGEVQRRLEEEDDFAVVQLFADLDLAAAVDRIEIEINGRGLRTVDSGGTYGVPLKDDLPGGDRVCYAILRRFEPGRHRILWSYAWNPPRDGSEVETSDGVTLEPLRIRGLLPGPDGRLAAPPASVDLRSLRACRCRLERSVEVPEGARALRLDASPAGSVALHLDGGLLRPREGACGEFALPPGVAGARLLAVDASDSLQEIGGLAFVE